jgi:hypothetical protein
MKKRLLLTKIKKKLTLFFKLTKFPSHKRIAALSKLDDGTQKHPLSISAHPLIMSKLTETL